MRQKESVRIAIAFMIALGLCACMSAAAAYDFPDDMPVRKPGLWQMVRNGILAGAAASEVREQYCLDAEADRALHELFILRKELQLVYVDADCPPPVFDAKGDVLRGEMLCRTNAPDDDAAAGKDFRWEYTVESDSRAVMVEHNAARGILFVGSDEFVEEQRRIGDCPAHLKPGDGIMARLGSRKEGEYDNIYESLKVMRKLLNEGKEINRRLGPM